MVELQEEVVPGWYGILNLQPWHHWHRIIGTQLTADAQLKLLLKLSTAHVTSNSLLPPLPSLPHSDTHTHTHTSNCVIVVVPVGVGVAVVVPIVALLVYKSYQNKHRERRDRHHTHLPSLSIHSCMLRTLQMK